MSSGVPTAAELIAEAHAATTSEELDAIEAQAEGRVTVINAVHDRRDVLARQADAGGSDVSEQPTIPAEINQQTVDEWRAANPTPASPPEVLELKPNTEEEAKSGPHEWPSPTVYVEMTKPDGSTFMAPKAQVEGYEALGYTAGAEHDEATE